MSGGLVKVDNGEYAMRVVLHTAPSADGADTGVSASNPVPVYVESTNQVNTGTSTQVASGTGAVTILAANTARYGASVANDDANALYLLLGAGTVSATVYTVKLYTDDFYEVPYGFTGILTGIWAGDGSGSARVTEYT